MGATKICKICGVEYPYCHTNIANQYRWQDVACSKEHAAQYFAQIAESRGQSLDSLPDEYSNLLDTKVEKVSPAVVFDEPLEVDLDDAEIEDIVENIAEFTTSKRKSKKKDVSY